METRPATYVTYLLRLWPAAGPGERSWRALLENPRTGERHVFRDLPALLTFLDARTSDLIDDTLSSSAALSDAPQPLPSDPAES